LKVRNCPVVARLLSTGQQEPDQNACKAAKTRSFGKVTQSGRQPGAIKRSLPKFMMHGTSVENALEILVCGGISPSPGICGDGIYGFELKTVGPDNIDFQDAVKECYARTGVGGYNRGAAFVLELDGILIKATNKEVVPAGCVSFGERKNEQDHQFSAAPSSVKYHSLIISESALVHQLDSYLKQSGYSAAMHDALKAAADFLANRPDSGSSGPGNMVSHFDILISRIEFMFLVFFFILNFEMLNC